MYGYVFCGQGLHLRSTWCGSRVHCRSPNTVRTVAQTSRNLWWFHRCSPRTSCGYASYCADSGSDVQKTVETFHSCSSWSMLLVSKFSTFSSPVCLIVLMIDGRLRSVHILQYGGSTFSKCESGVHMWPGTADGHTAFPSMGHCNSFTGCFSGTHLEAFESHSGSDCCFRAPRKRLQRTVEHVAA